MGIEVLIGVALAAASVAGGFVQASAQSKAAKEAAAAQREANDIQSAAQTVENRQNRRQAIREERIRRARIIQQSETTGVSGSSGQIGATGSLNTNTGNAIGFQSTQERAAYGIGQANQRAVDARTRGQVAGIWGQAFQGAVSGLGGLPWGQIFS